MVAQVKGGTPTLSQVRDFRTAMQNVTADLGVFVITRQTDTWYDRRGSTCRNISDRCGWFYDFNAPSTDLSDTGLFQGCSSENALWREAVVVTVFFYTSDEV